MEDTLPPAGRRAPIRAIPPRGICSLIVLLAFGIIIKDASVEVIIALAMLMLVAIILILVTKERSGNP
ncbi:MAG: hypothetical protein ACRDTC_15940 [Pseudonocardiaceae bacterium]